MGFHKLAHGFSPTISPFYDGAEQHITSAVNGSAREGSEEGSEEQPLLDLALQGGQGSLNVI